MNKLEQAVQSASRKWQDAFNAGDAAGCAACYEPDAVMVAKPLGTFVGRDEIQGFWEKLIGDGYKDIVYLEPKINRIDEVSASLSAGWKMNKAQGVITLELWVLQNDGEALLRQDRFEVQG